MKLKRNHLIFGSLATILLLWLATHWINRLDTITLSNPNAHPSAAGSVKRMEVSPDGAFLAVLRVVSLEIRSTETWELVKTIPGRYFSLAWSPDGRFLCIMSDVQCHIVEAKSWTSTEFLGGFGFVGDVTGIGNHNFLMATKMSNHRGTHGGLYSMNAESPQKDKSGYLNPKTLNSVPFDSLDSGKNHVAALDSDLGKIIVYSGADSHSPQKEHELTSDENGWGTVSISDDGNVIAWYTRTPFSIFKKLDGWKRFRFKYPQAKDYLINPCDLYDKADVSGSGEVCAFLHEKHVYIINCADGNVMKKHRTGAVSLAFLDDQRIVLGGRHGKLHILPVR